MACLGAVLLEALSDKWGWHGTGSGKVVWFRLARGGTLSSDARERAT